MTGVSILEKKGGNGFRRSIALINMKQRRWGALYETGVRVTKKALIATPNKCFNLTSYQLLSPVREFEYRDELFHHIF